MENTKCYTPEEILKISGYVKFEDAVKTIEIYKTAAPDFKYYDEIFDCLCGAFTFGYIKGKQDERTKRRNKKSPLIRYQHTKGRLLT